MRIHLARIGTSTHVDASADAFERLAGEDVVGSHELTPDPETADVILFTQCHLLGDDWRLRTIREHPLTLRFPQKVMVYDERDRPWCAFPGVYVSMPQRHLDDDHQRAWAYYTVPDAPSRRPDPDLLFSLIASNTARCRRRLLDLRHPDAVVEEPVGFTFFDSGSPNFADHRRRFTDIMGRSHFVLCPRGRGTSSIRLFETLAAGRVPVVIADDWAPPSGPDWSSCSIRWPEHSTAGLVEHLGDQLERWPQMSAAAARVHDEHFARPVSFDHIAGHCADLREHLAERQFPRGGTRGRPFLEVGADMGRRRVEGALRRRARRLLDAASRSGR